MSIQQVATSAMARDSLAERFRSIRRLSKQLAERLSEADCAIQSMPEVSPTKWHLAHTTWFFETFLLAQQPGYRVFHKSFAYLFNSYYNSIGKQFPRADRGLISRPSLAQVMDYREHVDKRVARLIEDSDDLDREIAPILEVGLHHEQQHQELILTDIKHVLSQNPNFPVYRPATFSASRSASKPDGRTVDEGVYWIGHDGDGFCFDNEAPRHRVFLDSFSLGEQLVTCGEYLRFMEDGGYERPELWLSLGWDQVNGQSWKAPLYWHNINGRWHQFTLAGLFEVDPDMPVCHVSYFEADAYARWAGARLPREVEWEVAVRDEPADGAFIESFWNGDAAIHPGCAPSSETNPARFFGDVWEWTASPYMPYPGYEPLAGALGEYNGKFMCNQYVLRGGSCATSRSHIRATYRNFFPPETRWQFSGIRLCR